MLKFKRVAEGLQVTKTKIEHIQTKINSKGVKCCSVLLTHFSELKWSQSRTPTDVGTAQLSFSSLMQVTSTLNTFTQSFMPLDFQFTKKRKRNICTLIYGK